MNFHCGKYLKGNNFARFYYVTQRALLLDRINVFVKLNTGLKINNVYKFYTILHVLSILLALGENYQQKILLYIAV